MRALTGLLLAGVFACKRPESAPADLIPLSGMATMLSAIYVAEVQAVREYDLKMHKDEYIRNFVYPALFDSLGVSDSTFFRSYAWYGNQPELLETLMDSVISRLEALPLDSVSGPVREFSPDERYRDLYDAGERMRREGLPADQRAF